MKINWHNKIEIMTGEKKYCFFNTMIKSVKEKLKTFSPYNKFLALGKGTGEHLNSNYHLLNYLKCYELKTDFLNNKISLDENKPFIKKTILIDDTSLDGQYISEAGITDLCQDNPIIYNYFSLTNDDCPNGILKEVGKPILISVYIYLSLETNGTGLFTLGDNKFISFLLGEGLSDNLYACKGLNIISNDNSIFRENPNFNEKFSCEVSITESADKLNLTFNFDLAGGEINEIVLLVGDIPFARINVQNFKANLTAKSNFSPKTNYVIDMGENVKSVSSVKNLTTNKEETEFYQSSYAFKFGDKISLPFFNMFSNNTARFLSKDGKMIFFVIDDAIYGYKNINNEIVQIKTNGTKIQNIINIVSFDDFVFVVSKTEPYIYAFKIENNQFENLNFDFSSLENKNLLSSILSAEIVLGKSNYFMLGLIESETHYGYVLYLTFNETTKTFTFESLLSSQNEFNFILGMQKNNFTDAMIMMLKGDEDDDNAKLVYFYQDKTLTDVYTTLAVQFTKNTKEVYTKNRAVIVEKTTEPHIWVYFFPQKYKYTLSLFGSELNDYISTDLHYLIQKLSSSEYKIYNLVGYNTPTEFPEGLPSEIDKTTILDFEFVGNILLIFTNNSSEPIVAYNLFENCKLIENVTSNSDLYEIEYEKYNLIGQNNEGVIVKFTIDISLWFFQIMFIKFLQAQIFRFTLKIHLICYYMFLMVLHI